jgi:beta-mannanase
MKLIQSAVLLVCLSFAAAASGTAAAGPSLPVASTQPASRTTGPLPANLSAPRQLGVTLDWSSTWASDIDAYAKLVGRMPSVIQTYRDMEYSMLNLSQLTTVSSRGALPLVTVEPWNSSTGNTADPTYSLKNIAAGNFDAWFKQGAQDAVSYGKTFYLRFAPEMNGNGWGPWENNVNGNTPALFVAAWDHVHAIFAAAGATNVKWVWSPTVWTAGGTSADFAPYWPGSSEADVLALDGYNWGSLEVWQTWTQIFGANYDELAALNATMPVMIAETASAEAGGNKASWITSALTKDIAARTPRVKTVVWFDENKETDWRVNSTSAALAAFKAVATSTDWG